jgi:hypothetical protein
MNPCTSWEQIKWTQDGYKELQFFFLSNWAGALPFHYSRSRVTVWKQCHSKSTFH